MLLTNVVDSDGRTNILRYKPDCPSLVAEIENPYGAKVTFDYDNNAMLAQIVDVVGLTNRFEYDPNYVWSLSALVTPYGRTTFEDFGPDRGLNGDGEGALGYVNRAITVTEPTGAKHLMLYRENCMVFTGPGTTFIPLFVDSAVVPASGDATRGTCNYLLYYRNSFYWSPLQYSALSTENPGALTTNDYFRARWRNWLHAGTAGSYLDGAPMYSLSQTVNLERDPSPDGLTQGLFTWYGYPGKDGGSSSVNEGTTSQPTVVSRRLPNGETQFTWKEYDSRNRPLFEISTYSGPTEVGLRTNLFVYAANGIDLLFVTNQVRTLAHAYGYNDRHQVTADTNELNEVTWHTYDANGRRTGTTTPAGLTTTNFYDANGWLTQTIALQIHLTNSYTYTNGLIHTHTDGRGLTLTNSYDALGRLTNVAYPDHTSLRYLYDKLDVVQVTDRLGFTTSYTFDGGRRKTSATDARGPTTWYGYCPCGSLEAVTNALLEVTTFTYDRVGHLTGITYPDSHTVARYYNLLGQMTNEVQSGALDTKMAYNHQGLLLTVSNSAGLLSATTYDSEDRTVSSTGADGVTFTNAYDRLGRLVARGSPAGGRETFAYSARGLMGHTNQLGASNYFGLDEAGRRLAETNANHEVSYYSYGPTGELLTLTDGKSQVTTWKYDLEGRLTNKLDNASAEMFRYRYDANGRLTNRWTPAKGNTGYGYDAAGNLTSVDYTSSPDLALAYDALNRLTNLVDAVGSTAYGYTSAGLLASEDGPWDNDAADYQCANRRRASVAVPQPGGSTWTQSFAFDGVGRLTNVVSPAGTFGYGYASGVSPLATALALPGGSAITNHFDALSRLDATVLRAADQTLLNYHGYGYDLAGQRRAVTNTYGDYRLHTYDNLGQLKTAEGHESSATNTAARAHEQFAYVYDAAGNLSERTDNALVHTFNLNELNQLTSITRGGTLTVAGAVLGNATEVTVNGAGAILYYDRTFAREGLSLADGANTFTAVARDNRGRGDTNTFTVNLPATVTLAYDANGNLTTNGTRVLTYDDENQLTSIQVPGQWKSDFQYDGKMRRRVRTEAVYAGGAWVTNLVVRYVYDGNLVLQERHNPVVAGTLVAGQTVTYTRGRDLSGSFEGAGGIGGLLARSALDLASGTGSQAYYHADANGNVTALANTNGALVGRYWYDPFGNTLGVAGAAAQANLYRFSSKELHEKSGLVYYLYRYYEPSLQRWLNRDPIGEKGGVHLYLTFRTLNM